MPWKLKSKRYTVNYVSTKIITRRIKCNRSDQTYQRWGPASVCGDLTATRDRFPLAWGGGFSSCGRFFLFGHCQRLGFLKTQIGTDEIALEVTRGLRLLLGFCLEESPREKDGNALGRYGLFTLVGGPNGFWSRSLGLMGPMWDILVPRILMEKKNFQMEWSAAVVQIQAKKCECILDGRDLFIQLVNPITWKVSGHISFTEFREFVFRGFVNSSKLSLLEISKACFFSEIYDKNLMWRGCFRPDVMACSWHLQMHIFLQEFQNPSSLRAHLCRSNFHRKMKLPYQ